VSVFAARLAELLDIGWNADKEASYRQWESRVSAFLASSKDEVTASEFRKIGAEGLFDNWTKCRERQMGHLEGLIVRIEDADLITTNTTLPDESKNKPRHPANKVFIVHGHDTEAKESVARFLERLRLKPIILHEQPNSGRTIIEKFEAFSDVGFAIVLLTPDDVGAPSDIPKELKARARQNVILELGYFMGKLSRYRVCALYKQGVEIPSDYQGILYIELDTAGAWRTKVAQELVEANFSIDLDGLLHS
jgi:predicted nucleotide-binding protein